jgi:hypothetical protein
MIPDSNRMSLGRAQVIQSFIIEMLLNFPEEFEAALKAAHEEID